MELTSALRYLYDDSSPPVSAHMIRHTSDAALFERRNASGSATASHGARAFSARRRAWCGDRSAHYGSTVDCDRATHRIGSMRSSRFKRVKDRWYVVGSAALAQPQAGAACNYSLVIIMLTALSDTNVNRFLTRSSTACRREHGRESSTKHILHSTTARSYRPVQISG